MELGRILVATLAQFQTDDKDFQLMQNSWATILNPIVNNPTNISIILKNISLASGDNTINHLLGRKLQGWKIVRQRASATLYDKQDANQSPQLTLILNASGAVVCDIEVF